MLLLILAVLGVVTCLSFFLYHGFVTLQTVAGARRKGTRIRYADIIGDIVVLIAFLVGGIGCIMVYNNSPFSLVYVIVAVFAILYGNGLRATNNKSKREKG